jgi:adenine-specific DNA methylase
MMDGKNSGQENRDELKPLAIEGKLPLKTVGIENLKEANPKHMPPHRYLHSWWARRPTAASRLAVLASVLPESVDSDHLLDLMKIGPRHDIDQSIAEYVEFKKSTEGNRDGTLADHYGYPRPFTQSPSEDELNEFHEILRQTWGGNLPRVFDPTAGGGVIPFESLRYGLPTTANELNPVPSLILKVMLEYAPEVGSLERELNEWVSKIDKTASENLEEHFPSANSRQRVSHYACTYTVECAECGCPIPLVKKWWLRKRSASKGVAAKPSVSENESEITYSCVTLPDDVKKSEFNPQDGPHQRGGAECLNCSVVTESDRIKDCLKSGDFEYEIYGVKYTKKEGGSGFRAPTEADHNAMERAQSRVDSDYNLHDFLAVDRYIGKEDRAEPYGVREWRDTYSPHQLISHYEFLQSFKTHREEILEKYDSETAQAILTILSLIASKLVNRNCRAAPLDTSKGYPSSVAGGKLFSLQWAFVDNNPLSGDQCYTDVSQRVIDSYEELVSYLKSSGANPADLYSGDASDLPIQTESIQAVVVDPPYYDAIIYSELSDFFYVWLKEYLQDTHSNLFQHSLTDKQNEAVANVAEFADVAGESSSKQELAKDAYEQKMSDIFSEMYRTLEPGGVMTVMFTHKETDAWDTLTMSLINSGFIVTSTHPITSEMPQRAGQRENASADSTLLLTGRKPHKDRNPENSVPTLWSDVQSDTREAAMEAARELIDSGMSLTKTDIIISAFGPTLRVFADAYPVVDDEDKEVKPRRALEEAREAVTQVLVDEYLDAEGIEDLDDVSEWYILSWLVYERETFSYDEGHQLGLGIGVDIDDIKRSTKTWRKSRGDISLRGHSGRVQNINEKPENRSSRTPVNPDDLSFGLALDKVHAAMHVYDVQGESACCDWLRERNFDSDSTFKATLQALLQVLPHDHEDWELARDLAVGRTRDVLDLDFSPNVFAEDNQQTQQTGIDDY